MKAFDEVFVDQTKYGTKIKTDDYHEKGAFPIIDQGQDQIAGFTDIKDGLFNNVPVIVFGDHTRVIKYVDTPFFLGADGVKVLKCKLPNANHKYLYYALKNARIPNTGYNRHFKWLKELSFNYPSADEQEKIVEILDNVSAVISARQQELQKLDDLIKARFVEMFGNPFDNVKWTVEKLKDISESLIDGSNVDTKYYKCKDEVLFLRIQNVWRNEFRLEDSVFISQEINQQQYCETSLKTGDLLITKIGRYYTKDSSLGRVSLYRGSNDGANYSNNIMRVRLKDTMNGEFVNTLLNLDEYQSYIKRTSKGGTDKRALSKSLIGNYPIIVPPKNLQDEFAQFVKQIDKSKFVNANILLYILITGRFHNDYN